MTGASRTLCRLPRLPGSSVFNSEVREFLTSFFLACVHPFHSLLFIPLLVSNVAKLLLMSSGTCIQERRGLPFVGVAQRIKHVADTGSAVALLGLQGLDNLNTFRFPKGSSCLIASCSCSMDAMSSFLPLRVLWPSCSLSSPYTASSRWLWFFMTYPESSSQMLGAQFSVQRLS